VCLDDGNAPDKDWRALACGHLICRDCLSHLVQRKCPLCAAVFAPRSDRAATEVTEFIAACGVSVKRS
jgi:hypothetical protein